ncbi:hypothetical protein HDU96_008569 [Phlyctochytrium bullatum]|nr:hypothetical protein HDU96_008569 [Phlyctochytrium bullatum]
MGPNPKGASRIGEASYACRVSVTVPCIEIRLDVVHDHVVPFIILILDGVHTHSVVLDALFRASGSGWLLAIMLSPSSSSIDAEGRRVWLGEDLA